MSMHRQPQHRGMVVDVPVGEAISVSGSVGAEVSVLGKTAAGVRLRIEIELPIGHTLGIRDHSPRVDSPMATSITPEKKSGQSARLRVSAPDFVRIDLPAKVA